MLLVTQLTGFSVLRNEIISANPQATAFNNADLTTYSFTSTAIGTASSDRYVAVAIGTRDTGTNSISSVTVAGQSCTALVTSGSTTDPRAIFITDAPVTSGTTATVAVTMANTNLRCGIGVYTITGGVPIVENTRTTTSGTLNVSAGGIILGMGYNNGSGTTVTFTGLTSGGTDTLEGPNGFGHGYHNATITETRTVTINATLGLCVSLRA